MRAAIAALSFVFHVAEAARLCSLSNAYKPGLNDTCSIGGSVVVVNAARGDVEAGVVLIDNSGGGVAGSVSLNISWDAGAAPPGVTVTPFLVTYVHTEKSPRYDASATGWFADALLSWPAGGAPLDTQLTAWINFQTLGTAAPGAYTGTITTFAAPAALPFTLNIFDVTIPALGDSPFSTVYAFADSALPTVYNSAVVNLTATRLRYLDALAALRFPSINIYAQAPLPIDEYVYLAAQGVNILILADISGLPFADGGVSPLASSQRGSLRFSPDGALRARADCPTYTQDYIDKMVAFLKPTWDNLTALGLQNRAFVYGFDEIDVSCEPAVRQLFGAAKAAFPGLRTLSAIDWPSLPLDLPLDTWVLQYQLVDRAVTDPWVKAGHGLYTYHCIEPHGAAFLNTFNEISLIQARLLFWYDFLLNVTGHLYYDVALWESWKSVPPFWASYTTASGVSFHTGLAPLNQRVEDARLTDWDPANWIWAPRTDIWANGDGVFIYPGAPVGGVGVPISTIRFESQRDGVEDWHVMRAAAAANSDEVDAIVKSQVSAPTVWSANTTLLEENRVRLLKLAASGSRGK